MSSILHPPQLVISHPALFTALHLDLFERDILSNPRATEQDASRFFARFPQFLLMGAGSEVRREVQLINVNGDVLGRVDFFRRSFGRPFWDIIELKTPGAALAVATNTGHPRLSNEIERAISQARDYKELLEADPMMRHALLARGILISRPELLVVAGRDDSGIPREVLERLFDRVRQQGVRPYSYTDIYEFAKESYSSHKVILVPAKAHESGEVVKEAVIARAAGRLEGESGDIGFLGRHYHGIDQGRRITMPSVWREAKGDDRYVALSWPPGKGECIQVMSSSGWRRLVARVEQLPPSDATADALRGLAAHAQVVRLDKAGRLTLPEMVLERTGIRDQAVLLGLLDRFQIWSPERFDAVGKEALDLDALQL